MNKEKFTNGNYFRIENSNNNYGSPTFKYNLEGNYISRQSRYSSPSENEKIIRDLHELNIIEINDNGFKGFTFILDTKIEVSYEFNQLIEYTEPVK